MKTSMQALFFFSIVFSLFISSSVIIDCSVVAAIPIIIAAWSIISSILSGVGLLKKFFGTTSPAPTILTLPTTTLPSRYPPSHRIIEDTGDIQYENSKQKKKSSKDSESDDHTSSSNPGTSVGLILTIALVLAVIAFIIYRKRTKFKQDRFSFRQTETSPSPPTPETEENLSSLWSAVPAPTQRQTLTIV